MSCRGIARQLFYFADVPFEDNRIAISQWPALKLSFAGSTPLETAWIDAVADLQKDYFDSVVHVMMLVKDVAIPAREKHFPMLEKLAKEKGNNGLFVNASLTWVDLLIADHVSVLLKHLPGFLDAYPLVVDTVKKIEETPKLKEWIEKRPYSNF
ncbi:hypothetical protein PRIPAC_89470 [Pristionchus pacificus]|uniref:glutathione transferase n=1 Tax=Pristionchus pacificus TaxID=54126 RepID=A0A2A6CWD7_PRIPA|nr:hypothetical protein PRIPAC_89470 [Pristionchus pacificus]|eukprot:PDM82554.1 hypothetical protein PRIPAC_36947 [Pristionchus pacificus]